MPSATPDPCLATTARLGDGTLIPRVGLGLWDVRSGVDRVVETALDVGYRHFDTASVYGTEAALGRALRGVNREQVFVTTKLWNTDHARLRVAEALHASLRALRLDFVDLYLIHWPLEALGLFPRAWTELERLRAAGLTRSIGVSNFRQADIRTLLRTCRVTPSVNQIECHPEHQQDELVDYNRSMGVTTVAYSPLAHGTSAALLDLATMASRHGKSPGQLVLRWHLQAGRVVLPKSESRRHLAENLDIFDFCLDAWEVQAIAKMERGRSVGGPRR